MSKTPKFDQKVKEILDNTHPGERTCALTGEKWIMKQEELDQYIKYRIPPHTWSPLTRLKYLTGFVSGVSIWKKPHMRSGKEILSFVHPDSHFSVISDKEWHSTDFSDEHSKLDSGESFFDQMLQLATKIPIAALRDDGSSVNSVGVDLIKCQDTYMAFGAERLKGVQYASVSYRLEDCLLMTNSKGGRGSYMINACLNTYESTYCFQNGDLMNCTFCFACGDLENCFGAWNKQHKKYLFWNEQLSKGEWESEVGKIDLTDSVVWEEQVNKFHDVVKNKAYWRHRFEKEPNEACEGEYFLNSVRCKECYWIDGGLDLYQCWMGFFEQDSFSSVWFMDGSNTCLSVDIFASSFTKYSTRVWRSQNMEYCIDCYDCEYCFGCVGLKRKKYHIYNKPYTEDEYWEKLDEIKCAMLDRGEYGQFFPAVFSQPGFQFSMGEFFLSYSDEELKRFNAPEYNPAVGNVTVPGEVVRAVDLPAKLEDLDLQKHIGKPILDEALGRMYVITQQEYAFYKEHKLPVPREHFLTRLTNLIRHSNTPIPEQEECVHCKQEMVVYKNTVFSGSRHILCKLCYLKMIEETN